MNRPVALALAAVLAVPGFARAEEEAVLGGPAPSFALKTMNGDVSGTNWFRLDALAGDEPEDPNSKVVLLTFFASWCAPCKKEMPLLVQLDTMYRGQGLRVVGVNIDKEEPGIEAAKKLLTQFHVKYPVVTDRFNFVARRYLGDTAPLPSVFLIKRDGTIAKVERGYSKDAAAFLLAEVQGALGLKATAAKGHP